MLHFLTVYLVLPFPQIMSPLGQSAERTRMASRQRVATVWGWLPGLLASLFLSAVSCLAAETKFVTGEVFEQTRLRPISVYWKEMPLGRGLKSLSELHKIAIVLDRRVDPTQRCSCELTDIPFEVALRRIASQRGLGIGTIGPLFVVGPPGTAMVLATAAARADDKHARFSEPLRSRLKRPRAWSWPRLSTPAQLVAQLAKEADLTVTNPQVIPHDLWDARTLPPLNWGERMLLVLSGFDMSFDVDGEQGTMVITNLPGRLSIRRTYHVPGDVNRIARELSEKFPQAFFQVDGQALVVRSLVEDHRQIARLLDGKPGVGASSGRPTAVDPALRRYTLTVQDEVLEPLLRVLARRTGQSLEIDDSAQSALAQRVTFSVKEVTVEELFRQAVQPAGLIAEQRAGTIIVRAK